jgi:Ca-activated chloride channel homolog
MKKISIIFILAAIAGSLMLNSCYHNGKNKSYKNKGKECITCPSYSGSDLEKPAEAEEFSKSEIKSDTKTYQWNQSDKSAKIHYSRKMAPAGTPHLNQPVMQSDEMDLSEEIQAEPSQAAPEFNTENYAYIRENKFLSSEENPLSTFSIDVDAASYSNTRRFLNNGSLPPADAVRIEEFVNYFSYNYTNPGGEHPFAMYTEAGVCPWNKNHQLIHIGIQGRKYSFNELPNTNLVFLIDVSGSMDDPNKLPLLKKSFTMMVNQLREKDRVAIVVYAGAAGLVLPSTSGSDKKTILEALDKLYAGGSTAGGEGIKLAYRIAKENLIKNGINRVILATDGDFNVGPSSDGELTRMIEERRDQGIFLSVLGFGMGNYKDSRMESIADNGNGNYFYIDNLNEARKVLVTELDGTLFTIAKDVKIQIEFNPEKIKAYRLVGYENRMLAKEDFNNDKKDAGELGAGHTVTAIYEIIPAESDEQVTGGVDPLKYQKSPEKNIQHSNELMTIKFRYKLPEDSVSKLIVHTLNVSKKETDSENFKFSAAVAGFGMLLRNSEFKGNLNYQMVKQLARESKGTDEEGHRAEFLSLVNLAETFSGTGSVNR